MDGPRRSPREAADALIEAVEVIRAMWSGERAVRFDGQYYHLRGVHPGPPPGADLGLWLGAYGPLMLSLTGRSADGWLPSLSFLPFDRVQAASRRIDAAAVEAGRNPRLIRKVFNINGIIGTESHEPFQGSVTQWVDHIVTAVTEFGMNAFSYWPNDQYDRQIAMFSSEVVPAARAALADTEAAG
ncbi:LLM class flavin-dependent oxidoreductase [Rhodococcus sp. NCIMB 12038]|uniref:LLM class flavin-dependent oxidoreductase n=1 Tax=Rhodococcus sp. NCIMB 12038 TaxID=933800 RepID=UPI000B3C3A4E|nr:LLM class flavin-dependent oxidoreductase [Rhodococcus sp. NCIMB 12038]OUS80536.1 hypothetical protein CA951_41950 [Rhodococcus sp. NCIMB 12038]